MKISKLEATDVERVVAHQCDRCGVIEAIEGPDATLRSAGRAFEFLHIKERGGYSNLAVGDDMRVEADLCQNCWWELLKRFARVTDVSR